MAQNIEAHGSAGSIFDVVVEGQRVRGTLPLLGEHSIYNALAGIAWGWSMECRWKRGASLATLSPVISVARCYRLAEPQSSMIATIRIRKLWKAWFIRWRRFRRSGISLLPARCWSWVRRPNVASGQRAGTWGATESTTLVGVRGLAKAMVEGAQEAGVDAEFVDTPEEAGEWLRREVQPGDAVLLKARGACGWSGRWKWRGRAWRPVSRPRIECQPVGSSKGSR